MTPEEFDKYFTTTCLAAKLVKEAGVPRVE